MGKYGDAITLDMWTDDYRKIEYLCFTAHYIKKEWVLLERVLSTTEWDSYQRKTAHNIRPAIVQGLRKYSLDKYYNIGLKRFLD